MRAERALHFDGGRYRFFLRVDDGGRLWIDNGATPAIDEWHQQQPREYTYDVDLAYGTHTLKFEHYEDGGAASAELWWVPLTLYANADVNPDTKDPGHF
jgi:hypothetical protein